MKILVVGLGKVGSVLAVLLARAGFKVVGFDIDLEKVNLLGDRNFIHAEPGLTKMARNLDTEQLVTTATLDGVVGIDAIFIIVPTPSESDGTFSNKFILSAINSIGPVIKSSGPHIVVSLVSTVMPGTSTTSLIPRLEMISKRKIGQGIGYAYNPAFIALGEIVRGFTAPEVVLIGATDNATGAVLASIHRKLVPPKTPIVHMRPVEVEIAKLASNVHETMRVSFVNMVLTACQETPESDVDLVTHALTFRHGQRLFRGATPYGGPCWPRDNRAMAEYLRSKGVPDLLPKAIHDSNREHADYILRKVKEQLSSSINTVLIAGLAYKQGTEHVEDSFGMWLASELQRETLLRVIGWDPLALEEARRKNPELELVDDLSEAMKEADLMILALPFRDVENLDWHSIPEELRIFDCWRQLDDVPSSARSRYFRLGSN